MWELLAPAGSYESIRAAVNAGADAVYAGGRLFGARAYADNPDEEHLIQGIEYCHLHGRKLYMTVNTLLKEQEIETMLYPYLLPYYESGVDGLIVQDFGVMRFVKEHFPDLPVHASTQMTVTGPEGARLLQEEGISRVVVARELSLDEIRAVAETGVEVEAFIHGAMCYSYSGQCLFSSILGGRSGNRGRCAQPCRLPFRTQASGEADVFPLSMKDLCTLDLLPEILDAGVSSLKIEGRMKRPEYTAGVVSVYRKYLDLYRNVGREGYHVDEEDRKALLDLYNRGGFSDGYYHTHNGKRMMSMRRPNHMGTAAVRVAAGKGGKGARLRMTALEPLSRGDVIELAPGREVTLSEDLKSGDPVRLPSAGAVRPGERILYRTKNAKLLDSLTEQYLRQERKEKVRGEFVLAPDGSAVLKLECRDARIEYTQEIAEPAQSRPTDEGSVRRQLQKTGNTPFEFEELQIRLSGNVFVPVSRLNELRRNAFLQLEEEILSRARRQLPVVAVHGLHGSTGAEAESARLPLTGQSYGIPGSVGVEAESARSPFTGRTREVYGPFGAKAEFRRPPLAGQTREVYGSVGAEAGRGINVLVTTKEQLEAVLARDCSGVDILYLDSLIFGTLLPLDGGDEEIQGLIRQVKQKDCRCFLNCPPVLRQRERSFFSGREVRGLMREMDGFLLHTVDELWFFRNFVRESGIPAVLAADETLYAYNRRAARFLRSHGITRLSYPAELNFRELLELKGEYTELTVYGYQALMQSAQCVVKNTSGCTQVPGFTYLTDRKNAVFPVLSRCPFCCNTVYNSVPLMLCGCRTEFMRLAPSCVRLSFTVETGKETVRIMEKCRQLLAGDEDADGFGTEGTRGHFRRGVE